MEVEEKIKVAEVGEGDVQNIQVRSTERGVWTYPPSHVESSLHRIILSGSYELNRLHLDRSDQSDPLLLRQRSAMERPGVF